jgi:hypothetical protein
MQEAEAGWRAEAKEVLEHDDPLALIDRAIVEQRYGGDRRPARVVSLAGTTRVLRLRRGGMLSHLLLIGPPSAGKSFTVKVVLVLFPDFAHHEIDAACLGRAAARTARASRAAAPASRAAQAAARSSSSRCTAGPGVCVSQ